jgi:hypothetical protein
LSYRPYELLILIQIALARTRLYALARHLMIASAAFVTTPMSVGK